MDYNDKVFNQIAEPRIKKFFDLNKDVFIAQAMDLKDLLQEMRLALWQKTKKYTNLGPEEYAKLINKILSTKLIDAKQRGYRHMKTEDITIGENDEEKVVKGHSPQFFDIDSVNESLLQNTADMNRLKAKTMLDSIKPHLSQPELKLLESIINGFSEHELACQQICCISRNKCEISLNPNDYISEKQSNISQKTYKDKCTDYDKLLTQSKRINRLRKQLVERMKKLAK